MFESRHFSLSNREKKIFLSIIIVALVLPNWTLNNSNSRVDLTKSLVNEQSLDISNYSNNTIDKINYNNKTYSDKAPGSSFLAVPVYTGFKFLQENLALSNDSNKIYVEQQKVFNLIENRSDAFITINPPLDQVLLQLITIIGLSAAPTAATLVLIYRTLLREDLSKRTSTLTTIVIGFGTIFLHFSTVFMANTLAMFFGFLSFYIIDSNKILTKSKAAAAGIAAGIAFIIEYYMIIVSFLLSIYLLADSIRYDKVKSNIKTLRQIQNLKNYFAGFLGSIVPLLIYNYYTTKNLLIPIKFFGDWVPKLTVKFAESRPPGIVLGPLFITHKFPEMLGRILFGIGRGFFIYSPVLLLAVPGLYYLWRKNVLKTLLISSIFFSFVIFNSIYITWYGGATFGSRYLLATIPFLAIPLGYAFSILGKYNHLRFPLTIIVVSSIFISSLGLIGALSHPTENLGVEQNYSDKFSESYGKITGIESYFNSLPYRIENVLNDGITSPWIELASGHPDKGLNQLSDTDNHLTKIDLSEKMVVIRNWNIEISLILLLFLILWHKELLITRITSNTILFSALASICVLILLTNVAVTEIYKADGWYESESTLLASDKSELKIAGNDRIVSFEINPFKKQNLTITANDNLYRFKLKSKRRIHLPLEKNINSLNFNFSDCQRPVKSGKNSDVRCISAKIKNLSILKPEEVSLKQIPYKRNAVDSFISISQDEKDYSINKTMKYSKNWYKDEDKTNKISRWMKNNSYLGFFSSKKDLVILEYNLRPFLGGGKNSRKIKMNLNSESLLNENISKDRDIKALLKVQKGINKLNFYSNSHCTAPSEISSSNDTRCLSFKISNLTLSSAKEFLGRNGRKIDFEGWYNEEKISGEKEHLRWMDNYSEINIYSSKDTTLNLFSYKTKRKATLRYGNKEKAYQIGPEGSNITIPRSLTGRNIKLESDCNIPKKVEDSSDERCLSIGLRY